MRADERRGAWILLILIIAIGIFIGLLGRCDGARSVSTDERRDENAVYSLDSRKSDASEVDSAGRDKSVSGETADIANRKSDNHKRSRSKSGSKSGSKRKSTNRTKRTKAPMRDILGDTINK